MPSSSSSAAGSRDPIVDVTPEAMGERLSTYRLQRGMKVSQLARLVGVSSSLISQIERGQSRPSVSTLFGMAEALQVPVDAFFRDTAPAPEPVMAGTAPDADPAAPAAASPRPFPAAGTGDGGVTFGPPGPAMPPDEHPWQAGSAPPSGEQRYVVRRAGRALLYIERGIRWERLTPGPLNGCRFLELAYAPGAESNPTLYRHPGAELVLVLSGHLQIFVGFERYELGPGDSISFPSSRPHRYANLAAEEARAITVILHDGSDSASRSGAGRP